MNKAEMTNNAISHAVNGRFSELTSAVIGRSESLFSDDLHASRESITDKISERRVLVVGGAGSIGAATVRLILDYRPGALHVIDQSENYLAELVRDLHGGRSNVADTDFRALPLDYGGPVMQRFLADAPSPYDLVLNFAALKHVRSEKDVYSVLQMFDTNIVRHLKFKSWLVERRHGANYFAVSTDKAANPVSLMGASKRLMEDLIFEVARADYQVTTSARFANVAFSNGSLLEGFCYRLAKRQPIAVPQDTRRYFLSHHEAAELCLIAACRIADDHLAIPRVDDSMRLLLLEDIASEFIRYCGFSPIKYSNEGRAKEDLERLSREGRWPLLLTPLDTSGEKPYEEFVGAGEGAVDCGLAKISALPHVSSLGVCRDSLDKIARWVNDSHVPLDKPGFVAAISAAIPGFVHAGSERSLDRRL